MVEIARNDDILIFLMGAASATAQMLELYKTIHPKYMCFDSASDSIEMYGFLLDDRNIIPVIDINKRNTNKFVYTVNSKPDFTINEKGIPCCHEGFEMVFDGYDHSRKWAKFRCPIKRHTRNVDYPESCPLGSCSKSEYSSIYFHKG